MDKRTDAFYAVTSGEKEYLDTCAKTLGTEFEHYIHDGYGILYVKAMLKAASARDVLRINKLYPLKGE